ncbi:hypothetical protein [Thermococcus pacificus]|uniref:Uncharacterized protein n=1 Tax=Thermococcus pacificus TaxID=71998 RepID=A0A218P822_9EURY|nr:hypothetical protein [Thermococcus pacificus]ASJ06923.1 hypothetical protein A3L08_06095 [Thermococcus pacificus]
MKENITPAQMKWGVSLIMTLAYAFGAAYFYYLPSRGEPGLEVGFWQLLLHFLVLSFLFWLVLIPEGSSAKAADLLMLTVLTVPAGVAGALISLFAVTGIGIGETRGLEYLVMALIPYTLAYKAVLGKAGWRPAILAATYWIITYLWGSLT